MNEFIVPLEKVRQSDSDRVGAKSVVLGTLLNAGFPVPSGICLAVDAFHVALAEQREEIHTVIDGRDLRDPAAAVEAADAIARILVDLYMPASVSERLGEVLPRITDQGAPLAVRSSATAEDGVVYSLAGQYTSVLGVQSAEAVEAAILAVWRSFFDSNALVARAMRGATKSNGAMAVLIQPVIEAECAGVCLSVDPVRQRQDLIVINGAWGLAPGVVDGSVSGDTAWVWRDRLVGRGTAVKEQRVREQEEQIVVDPQGGLHRVPVPEERRRAACLPETWLRRVAQLGVAAEQWLGRPQDVEWAIADHRVWLIQSRPITALPKELAQKTLFPVQWDGEDQRRFWRRRAVAGVESGLLPPLERDHQARVESMREETCRFMAADKNGKLSFFNGRPYACRLPLGLTKGDVAIRRAAREDLKERLKGQGLTSWDYWGPEAVRAVQRLRAFDLETEDGRLLADHLENALAVRRRHYMLHPLCWFKPDQSFFEAFANISGLEGDAAEAAAYRLLDGGETPLTRLMDDLYALACTARERPRVAYLVADPPPDVIQRLVELPDAAAFRARFDTFLEVYGAYNGNGWGSEATLLTPTWAERPELVLRLMALYLEPGTESPAALRARARLSRAGKVEALCAACADEEAVAEFRNELAYARKGMTVLENHNPYLDQRPIGHLRHAVLAAADWLVARGALTERDDVFWLHFDEITASLLEDPPPSLEPTVAARKAEHAQWEQLVPPPVLGVPDAHLPGRPPLQDDVTRLASRAVGSVTGLGASPGRAAGRARVVAPTVLLPDLSPGDVLVTENVGPRWTPLFSILGGLVLDSGSLGQHAAATAREYGVPAVIETGSGTRHIPDGASVIVDGTEGTVVMETGSDQVVPGE